MIVTKKALFIFTLLIATLPVSAQWTQQNVGVTNDLYGVSFSGADNIFLSGVAGLVKSTNGGTSWSTHELLTTTGGPIVSSILYDSHFFDADTGVATGLITTGNSEVVMHTVNGGLNWSFVSLLNTGNWPRNLNDIYFLNATMGFAVGTNGRVLRTVDAGNTWGAISVNTNNDLKSIFFASTTTGFIVGDEVILKTTNGGASWQPVSFQDYSFNAIWFNTINTGYVVGESGVVLKTTNAGATWQEMNILIGGTFNDICFVSPTTGFIATNSTILKTTDGGNYWETMPSADGHDYKAIAFKDANNGYAVGTNGTVMTTTNAGGPGRPIASFDNTALCLDLPVTLTNTSNPAYDFEWQLDGQTFSTAYDASLTISDGSQDHLISLIADNGAYSDTQSIVFSASQSLDIDLQTGIYTQWICQSGRDTLYVYDSEPNTSYRLWINSVGSTTLSGNGDTLVFPVGPQGSNYTARIIANRTVSGCGTASDTAAYNVNVIRRDLPVSLDDSLLCKEESLTITISDTDPGVYYTLRRHPMNLYYTNVFGTSAIATGAPLSFETLPITDAGPYYLRAHLADTECSRNFSDTIFIDIEETAAHLHASYINATVGENVNFFENCVDADNYQWSFTPDASIGTSTLPDPTVSFGSLGSTQVELICWSDNGCYDTIVAPGPMIYQSPTQIDPVWINNYFPVQADQAIAISTIHKGKTGYLICGTHDDAYLATQHGDSVQIVGKGCFVAKYDFDGTLKWKVNTTNDSPTNYNDHVWNVVEDSGGNIYFNGSFHGPLKDNTGDSITLSAYPFSFYFSNLIKLDSTGRHIWTYSCTATNATQLFIDHSDNLFLKGFSHNAILNGTLWDTLPPYSSNLIKLSPEAELLWSLRLSNAEFVDFDSLNNVYIVGDYTIDCDFYSSDGTLEHTLSGIVFNNYAQNIYVAKYDSTGSYQWAIRGVIENQEEYSISVRKIETDGSGNTYLTGGISCCQDGETFKFDNADATETSTSSGIYMVAKINTSGVCEWINGVNYTLGLGGYGISLLNDEISVMSMFNGSLPVMTTEFTSTNGNGIQLSMNRSDYAIVVYDPEGNLKRVFTNWINESCITTYNYDDQKNMFQTDDGAYYYARTIDYDLDCPSPYFQFGDGMELLAPGGQAPYVIRFEEEYGVNYLPGYNDIDTVFICTGTDYTFPDGNVAYNVGAEMIHSSHLQGANGLDSTIITLLDTLTYFETEEFINVCSNGEHTFPDGTTLTGIDAQTVHASYFSAVAGCDSIVLTTVNPVLPQPTYYTHFRCIGDSFVFPDGTTVDSLVQNVTHTSVLTSTISACDSLVTYTVSLEIVNPPIAIHGDTLSTNFDAEVYQWLDCETGLTVSGATTNTLIAPNGGSFALIATGNWCVMDTTACYQVFPNPPDGILDNGSGLTVNIFPNPTDGTLHIELPENVRQAIRVELLDASGKLVFTKNSQTNLLTIDLTAFAQGIYTCKVLSEDNVWIEKVIYK